MICLKTIWVLIWPFIFWFLVEHLVLAMWFFTHSVLIQVFVFQPWLCPCGYVCYVCMRVSTYDSLTFIIFLALVCTGKLKFISSTKKTQELPCGLLLKLTITPQYAITVITHSCPINNTAVIFYWIVWGCWKCKGDLGLKLEVGSWVGTGNFYLASQLRENLCSTHKHWTFPSFLMHTRLHHVMHAAEHKCSFILIHELPFQTPDWVLRSRFDFLLKGLLCLTMFAY